MQGTHQEGEFRQLEIWTWKSYVRLPIMHNSKQAKTSRRFFMEYLRNIGANNYQRGPTRWAQPTWARQGAQVRPGGLCPPRPTSGAHLLVYKSFWPRKNKARTFMTKRRHLEAELGQEHFCPLVERFRQGKFPPGGEIEAIVITNNPLIFERPIFINIFNNTISSQILVHVLCSIFVSKPQIGTYRWLVVLITSCSWC